MASEPEAPTFIDLALTEAPGADRAQDSHLHDDRLSDTDNAVVETDSLEELGELFYRRIAPLKLFPEVPCPPGKKPILGRIENGNKLIINEAIIELSGHQLYLFNALMMLRHMPQGASRSELMQFNFGPDVVTENGKNDAFSSTLKYLMPKLYNAHPNLLRLTGSQRWRRYHLSPCLHLEEPPPDPKRQELEIFYQQISGALISLSGPVQTFVSPLAPSGEVKITGDKSVLASGQAAALNDHERYLFNLLLLNGGRPLTTSELQALGFHLYARGEKAAWESALYRTLHSLGRKLAVAGAATEALALESGFYTSLVRWAHQLVITDARPHPLANQFLQLVGDVRTKPVTSPSDDNGKNPHIVGPIASIDMNLVRDAFLAGRLSLREAWTLSLRHGIVCDFLAHTVLPIQGGEQIVYDDVAANLTRPMALIAISSLFGTSSSSSIDYIQKQALAKINAFRPEPAPEETAAIIAPEEPPVEEMPEEPQQEAAAVQAAEEAGEQNDSVWLDEYATARGVDNTKILALAERHGVEVFTDDEGDGALYLDGEGRRHLDVLLAPRPGFVSASFVTGVLRISPGVLDNLLDAEGSSEAVIPLQADPEDPQIYPHLMPDKAAEIARTVIARRLAEDSSASVTIGQIALLTQQPQHEVRKRIGRLLGAEQPGFTYNGTVLGRILHSYDVPLGQMGIDAPPPATSPAPTAHQTPAPVTGSAADIRQRGRPAESAVQAVPAPDAQTPHAGATFKNRAKPLDVLKITEITGLKPSIVEAAIEATRRRLGDAFESTENWNRESTRTPHFTGATLGAIEDELLGMTPNNIAGQLRLPQEIVTAFLAQHYKPERFGRYTTAAFDAAKEHFARAPLDYVRVSSLDPSLSEEDIIAQLTEGAEVGMFYDSDGQQYAYVKKGTTIKREQVATVTTISSPVTVASVSTVKQAPRHRPQQDHSAWQPSAQPSKVLLHSNEELTIPEIAARFHIKPAQVQEALERIDPATYKPDQQGRYSGAILVLIREQIIGVSWEYIRGRHNLSPEQATRVRDFMRRHGWEIHPGDRYAPGADAFLNQHITVLKTETTAAAS